MTRGRTGRLFDDFDRIRHFWLTRLTRAEQSVEHVGTLAIDSFSLANDLAAWHHKIRLSFTASG